MFSQVRQSVPVLLPQLREARRDGGAPPFRKGGQALRVFRVGIVEILRCGGRVVREGRPVRRGQNAEDEAGRQQHKGEQNRQPLSQQLSDLVEKQLHGARPPHRKVDSYSGSPGWGQRRSLPLCRSNSSTL